MYKQLKNKGTKCSPNSLEQHVHISSLLRSFVYSEILL